MMSKNIVSPYLGTCVTVIFTRGDKFLCPPVCFPPRRGPSKIGSTLKGKTLLL